MSKETIEPATEARCPSRATWLILTLVVTLAARAIPGWYALGIFWQNVLGGEDWLPYELFHNLVLLLLGLLLALSAPRQSGLRIGEIREHWRGVLLVCGLPILASALVYPNLQVRPFAESHWSMWSISPLAQELVFTGFIYGQLNRVFPGWIHSRIPLNRALVLSGVFFAIWHLPNLAEGMPGRYMAFQLCYVFLGAVTVGLARQWTGSIWYVAITHTVINAIAWWAD